MIAAPAVNYLAVAGAAVASMAIGMLWYGPLFGKKWMSLMGLKSMKMGSSMSPLYGFIGALVMSYVLANIVGFSGAKTLADGAITGFWVWLGFIAVMGSHTVIWENKPKELYFLNMGYWILNLLVMGAILAAWA